MATVDSVKTKLQSLIASCQAVTGDDSADLTSQLAILTGLTASVSDGSIPTHETVETKLRNLLAVCQAKTGDGSADLTAQVKMLIDSFSAGESPAMYLYGHEAEKTVTYNDVELPPLPNWDKTAYPYAFISYNTAGFYSLRCFDKEPSVRGAWDTKIEPYGSTGDTRGHYISTTSSVDKWNELSEPSEYVWLSAYVAENMVWTNFDLRYNGTETVYFTGSDPVTTYINADVTIDDVGYVGAVLPKLPEWDRESYPYAFISNEIFDTVWFFALSECPATNGTATSKGTIVNPYDADIQLVQSKLNVDGNSWGELSTGNLGTSGQISLPFWANFDIYHRDNTIFLSASDPLPVYE